LLALAAVASELSSNLYPYFFIPAKPLPAAGALLHFMQTGPSGLPES
jgi:hypothetical protein